MMMRDERQDGGETGIVPANSQQGGARSGLLWYAGIAISVAVMAHFSILGVVCLAMGLRTQAERFGARGLWIGSGISCAVLIAWGIAFGIDAMAFAIPLVGACIAVSALMWKQRASVLAISLVIAASTAFSMLADALLLARAGVGLDEAMLSMLEQVGRAYVGRGVEAELALKSALPVFESIWPVVYVTSAFMNVAFAGFGSLMGGVPQVRPGTPLSFTDARVRVPRIGMFDAPLWAVGLLALSVLGIAVSTLSLPYATLIRCASATLLLSVRYIFTLQGLGVLSGVLARWRLGCFARTLIIMVAVSLEAMFVLSIIGLVDVWANFRKLPRDGSHLETQE